MQVDVVEHFGGAEEHRGGVGDVFTYTLSESVPRTLKPNVSFSSCEQSVSKTSRI